MRRREKYLDILAIRNLVHVYIKCGFISNVNYEVSSVTEAHLAETDSENG
jgi:hypothetical protein